LGEDIVPQLMAELSRKASQGYWVADLAKSDTRKDFLVTKQIDHGGRAVQVAEHLSNTNHSGVYLCFYIDEILRNLLWSRWDSYGSKVKSLRILKDKNGFLPDRVLFYDDDPPSSEGLIASIPDRKGYACSPN